MGRTSKSKSPEFSDRVRGVETTFHRMTNRRGFACSACGDHVCPTARTIFEDTSTALQDWFHALRLFVTTRHGASGGERGSTTYKTAWPMGRRIRERMDRGEVKSLLTGHVEIERRMLARSIAASM